MLSYDGVGVGGPKVQGAPNLLIGGPVPLLPTPSTPASVC